jgi:hypothetical protein
LSSSSRSRRRQVLDDLVEIDVTVADDRLVGFLFVEFV